MIPVQLCGVHTVYSDAKTCEVMNNVCVYLFPTGIGSVQNFTLFVKKVKNVAILRCLGNTYGCYFFLYLTVT